MLNRPMLKWLWAHPGSWVEDCGSKLIFGLSTFTIFSAGMPWQIAVLKGQPRGSRQAQNSRLHIHLHSTRSSFCKAVPVRRATFCPSACHSLGAAVTPPT